MFGLASFFGAPFMDVGGSSTSYVTDTVTTSDAFSATVVFASAVADTPVVSDTVTGATEFITYVEDAVVTDDLFAETVTYPMDWADAPTITDEFLGARVGAVSTTIRGFASVEFVSTTLFIDLVEEGRERLSIAAEIKVRSL